MQQNMFFSDAEKLVYGFMISNQVRKWNTAVVYYISY